MIEDWSIRLHAVDADGSCFFSSIANALNVSVDAWKNDDKLINALRVHWHKFLKLGIESPDNFTPKFVRYMASTSIDQDDLVAYNNIASADGKKKLGSVSQLKKRVLHSNCWVDSVTFGAFLKSLDLYVSVVVIDDKIKEPLVLPKELTHNKKFYICLWLQDSHYQPVEFVYRGESLPFCVSREHFLRFIADCYPNHSDKF